MNQKTKGQTSFEDSLFTEDILDDICKIEYELENANKENIASDSKGQNNVKTVSNEFDIPSNSNSPKSSTPIIHNAFNVLPKLHDQSIVKSKNSSSTPRYSKRLLNKRKLQNLSDSLESNSNEINIKENNSPKSPAVKRNVKHATSSPQAVIDSIQTQTENKSIFLSSNKKDTASEDSLNENKISSNNKIYNTQTIKTDNVHTNNELVDSQKSYNNFNASITRSTSFLSFEHKLELSSLGLPKDVLTKYNEYGISKMFPWQVECLSLPGVLEGQNLIYSAPTSAGKTLVAEILLLKRVLEQKKKGIFILPFVSIAREKTYSLQRLFGVAGVRVEGFMGGQSPPGGFQKTDIAICTIEKANNIINRLIEDQKVDELGIIVVDELHMVGDSHRGYLLELLLTKLQFITSFSKKSSHVQVIGMSATLPNLDVLASWQKAKLYCTSFRPIPLLQMVKIGNTLYEENFSVLRNLDQSELNIKDDGEHLIQLCLETILDGYSVLIFCPTKAWCEKIALSVASNFYAIGKGNSTFPELLIKGIRNRLNGEDLRRVIEALRACPAGLDPVLERSLAFGAAFHHAGLTFDERDIIEGAFRAGYLPVLVATSTLSSGVNLPARRVIIRSPNSGGQLMNPLVYKQMIGRAGRKGKDTQGESILMCGLNEKYKAEQLVKAMLPPITSCLQKNSALTASMKRAVLEIVVSGAAKTLNDIKLYWECTLLAASVKASQGENDEKSTPKPAVEESVQYLLDNELASYEESNGETIIKGSQLGSAILASGFSPDEGLHVFSELQRARQCFVLENEMHVVYQVTPIYVSDAWPNLDWLRFLEIWEALPHDMKRVGELVGIQESFIVRAMKGTVNSKIPKQRNMLAIHQRFYASLALHDLVHEVSLQAVVSKYGATKGLLQALQQSAATFAGMVTVFCNRLCWHNLELLIAQYQNRLQFGIQRDLCDLVKISLLNGYRARLLFDAGLLSVTQIAHSNSNDIANILNNAGPFQSSKTGNTGGFILGPTGAPMSITEASKSIVTEARTLVQKELGLDNIDWSNKDLRVTDLKDNSLTECSRNKNCESSTIDSSENSFNSEINSCRSKKSSNSRKRMSSESSKDEKSPKSPKFNEEKSKIQDMKNENKEKVVKDGNFVSPTACIQGTSLSEDYQKPSKISSDYQKPSKESSDYQKPSKESPNCESGYSSDASLKNKKVELNSKNLSTLSKDIIGNCDEENKDLDPKAFYTPPNVPSLKPGRKSGISKPKPKGSFLFAKSSRGTKNVSVDDSSHSSFIPDSQDINSIKTSSSTNNYELSNGQPILHSGASKNTKIENSSFHARSSTSLSDSLKAQFMETTFEDDISFLMKNEKSKRDSSQSEDFFGNSSDEENDGIAYMRERNPVKCSSKRNSIEKKVLRTPVYNVCTEELDFGYDLSKTKKRSLGFKESENVNFQNESIFVINSNELNSSDLDLANDNISVNEESLVMTESGVLSLTRECIEKDLNEFESSLLEKNNISENFHDSKMESSFDKAFENHSFNDSFKYRPDAKGKLINNNEHRSSPSPNLLGDFSTFILTPRTEKMLDGNKFPNQDVQNKEHYILDNPETKNISKHNASDLDGDSESFISHSISLGTGRPLSIIDVASDEKLFNVFIKEWKSKDKFSLSLACEAAPNRSSKEGIGWKFSDRARKTQEKRPVAGLIIEQTQLLLTGISVSWGETDAYFINLKRTKGQNDEADDSLRDVLFPTPAVSREVSLQQRIISVRSVLSERSITKTIRMWNVKETLKLLYRSGIVVAEFNFQDPRVAVWLLDPTAKQKNIHNMVLTYCEEYSYLFENIGSTFGLGSMGICRHSSKESSSRSIRVEASTESVLIFHLCRLLESSLSSAGLKDAWEYVEMPSLYIFTIMELNGMGFSQKECNNQKQKLQEKLGLLEAEAYRILGRPFSISSPDEVSKIIYTELNLHATEQCSTFNPRRRGSVKNRRMIRGPTNKEALEKLKDKHPLPKIVLEWRRINSALTKVVYPLSQELVSCAAVGEDRIFPICHTFTATGRVTFHEPNVQNIPKDFAIELPERLDSSEGKNRLGSKANSSLIMKQLEPLLVPVENSSSCKVSLRHTIVAGKNRVLLASDYSQLELRILAHLSRDTNLLKILNDGEDVFINIASRIHSKSLTEVTDDMRQEAKKICYGIIYGMGEKSLGEQLGMEDDDARNFICQFHRSFPLISKFIDTTVNDAREKGYVVTLEGRKRFLPGINSSSLSVKGQCERQAVNTRIQGSAADLVKKALISIHKKLNENFTSAPKSISQKTEKGEVLSGGYLVLQLHDELIYEVANDDVIQVAQIVKESMENAAGNFSVKLPIKIKVGPTWGTVQILNL